MYLVRNTEDVGHSLVKGIKSKRAKSQCLTRLNLQKILKLVLSAKFFDLKGLMKAL